MRVAVTGATGFLGHYIVDHLIEQGHEVQAWTRPDSDRSGLDDRPIDWIEGELNDLDATKSLLNNCDALVHAALWRPGSGFRGAEGDVATFAEKNLIGSLQLFQAAAESSMQRVVYVSSCAVHEQILEDRPLDEAHPLWANSHYGAHKAAVEAFVHSFAASEKLEICAIRPTGIYGVANLVSNSKWYDLVSKIRDNKDVQCDSGGKEVNASDVAKAIGILLTANDVAGQAFACYDRYISDFEVASMAKEICSSSSRIDGTMKQPKHHIDTGKIHSLGMRFGGESLLRQTIQTMVEA